MSIVAQKRGHNPFITRGHFAESHDDSAFCGVPSLPDFIGQ